MRTFLTKTWWLLNVAVDFYIAWYYLRHLFVATSDHQLLLDILALALVLFLHLVWRKWLTNDAASLFKRKKRRGAGAY